MAEPFVDTNIFVRHLVQDHLRLSAKASAILSRVEQGDLVVRTTDTVIFETVFTLSSVYRMSRSDLVAGLSPLIELPGVVLPGKEMFRAAFDLFLSTSIGFADCYHATVMRRLGLTEVLSFDRDFDKLPGITRREE
jgi:predicted nucleic acid-binding protein